MLNLLKRIVPRSVKTWALPYRSRGIALLAGRLSLTRGALSRIYLRGKGIEIGSLNWPLEVSKDAHVTYVDALPTEALGEIFPEFKATLLPVEIVASIDTLEGIADESQEFFVANHVLEHSENPLGAMRNIHRVLRKGGVLFLSLPDKRYTFDVDRPVTRFDHLLRDDREGPAVSRRDHYQEFGQMVKGLEGEALDGWVLEQERHGRDIHFHVWTQAEMLEMIVRLRLEEGVAFDVEAMSKTGIEAIFVLRKLA